MKNLVFIPKRRQPFRLDYSAGGCVVGLLDPSMTSERQENSSETLDLLNRARAGEPAALDAIFSQHRERLRRMVEIRLDRRLQARVDASDVIQEAYVDVVGRLQEYLNDPRLPLFLWLRLVVGDRLMKVHRQHLGAQLRAASRRVVIGLEPEPPAAPREPTFTHAGLAVDH
jgi:DNA-directed RNA polymerase specialized sigma24 family protein